MLGSNGYVAVTGTPPAPPVPPPSRLPASWCQPRRHASRRGSRPAQTIAWFEPQKSHVT